MSPALRNNSFSTNPQSEKVWSDEPFTATSAASTNIVEGAFVHQLAFTTITSKREKKQLSNIK